MEDKRQSGYPIYTEDELGLIQQVVSGSDCTGLEPTPPDSPHAAEAYSELNTIPQQTDATSSLAKIDQTDLSSRQ